MKPLALDLCCGKGGWAKGLIDAGWEVVGVDVEERFRAEYPGRFYCGDVRDVPLGVARFLFQLVVASPPCQEFSRHDQPWTLKRNPPPPDTSIWEACVRIAAECGAPLILENVRGAQKFMGRAKWHCGPFYLWGDVPALMPKLVQARKGFEWWGKGGERGREIGVYRTKESRSISAVAERSMVPYDLALHIGRVFHPGEERCA